jgi:hypothetical protein
MAIVVREVKCVSSAEKYFENFVKNTQIVVMRFMTGIELQAKLNGKACWMFNEFIPKLRQLEISQRLILRETDIGSLLI